MAQDAQLSTLRHSTIIYYLLTINYDTKGLSPGIIVFITLLFRFTLVFAVGSKDFSVILWTHEPDA
jgi:hypothetical protein